MFQMNPLCCIAPVSLERDKTTQSVNGTKFSKIPAPVDATGSSKPQKHSSSTSLNRNTSLPTDPAPTNNASRAEGISVTEQNGGRSPSVRPKATEGACKACNEANNVTTGIAGIVYKWVNYGKGWKSRWFVLKDGVLSYYKIHGRDKIALSQETEKGLRLIGEESLKIVRKPKHARARSKQRKPFGEVHLKVSSIRESKSDDKRFSIFTGTKTLHLRTEAREDRAAWIEALLASKDLFPRGFTKSLLLPIEDISVSTEKLRHRLLQERLNEQTIEECEQIMISEFSELQNQLKILQQKQLHLIDMLRQLEAEKVELETTVVDESQYNAKVQDVSSGSGNGRYSEGTGTESDEENESQDGVDGETDEDVDTFFDTKDYLSSESLRSTSPGYARLSTDSREDMLDDKEFRHSYSLNERDADMERIGLDYPHVERRTKLPEPKEKEKAVGLWSIIKENIGKDLSGVCLPVYFNEPLSSLQKCFEDLEYSYLIDRAAEWGKRRNSLMRILNVAAFAVSGYASTEGRHCKPFNPLLGETYEADYPDKGLRFFSEKVSHHPMIVACHCEGRGWKFWGDSNLKGKFWGRSIQLDPVGVLSLKFDDGECFQWSKVTTSIYNIILGKLYCDHYGTMRIQGSGEYSCKLKFKEQSIIDRNPHQVQGFVQDRSGNKVATLIGKWDDSMYFVLGDVTSKPKGYDPMSEACLLWKRNKPSSNNSRYNLTPFAIALNELTPDLKQKLPPTDSRLRPDQRHLENGEYDLANVEKLRLEQSQRQSRKLQERGWQPRWFRKEKGKDTYEYIGGYWEVRDQSKWEGFPDIFGQTVSETPID
ncbi:oxysterol-binding protein-related protein 1A isoform X1 [Cryptomeria japonica]|uniref:oxysterol-binding protein-related protein 1A isoform X1 n=2 Tax=Cryptomeria japonica TaxID=3369 RepID=UPI0027DA8B18|nr:oxysterol-binding protein-related protein 1A isoform X1 [Cryptomeria japonica]